jgi:outer membrane protein insertion porin family
MDSCGRWRRRIGAAVVLALAGAAAAAAVPPAAHEPAGQRISRVEVRGNQRVTAHRVLGQMRLREGSLYTPEAADQDLKRIYDLREFDNVILRPEQEDGRLALVVEVVERPVLGRLEFLGNRHFTDEQLAEAVGVRAGGLVDRHRIFTAAKSIEQKYRDDGYYFAKVTLDEPRLAGENVAHFTLSEGPRVRISKIAFVGNPSIPAGELQGKMQTRSWWPLLASGIYDEEQVQRDLVALRNYYIEQGFLDVKIDRELDFKRDRTRLTVRIIVAEGPRYQVRSVELAGVERFSPALLKKQMALQPGKVYEGDKVRSDVRLIQDTYGEVGYVDAFVRPVIDFGEEPGIVDVTFKVEEREQIRVGRIRIEGNRLTQDKVIRRALRFYPEEPINTKLIDRAHRRLEGLGLFEPGSVQVATIPTQDPAVRDVVVRVEETETANLIFGAGISSDSGVLGNVSFVQRNFDLTGWPRSSDEFWRGEAFRGAGQLFQVVLEPGTELQRYRMDFKEPALFDSDVGFSTSGFFFDRERDDYDERRLGGTIGFSKEVRPDLHAFINFRGEHIDIRHIEEPAPQDLKDVAGGSVLTSIEVGLLKDTTDSYFFPSEGYRVRGSVEQAGAMGGDYTFTKLELDARRYWTVTRDVLDRRSVLSVRGKIGYIAGGAPLFERFYAGGIGTMRGFEFRGVGPREFDTEVGGDFLILGGVEYAFPLIERSLTGVLFLDTGTVERDFEVTTWRLSAGAGLRFTVPFFGPVPFAFDFGFPIVKDDEDETQVFSFTIGTAF